ncbi:MAG: hypothetical protein C4527_21985 [Candidatus Omnitrophota bacterium]|jgi:predicted ATPase|nr:MAG: hypothetical protein C4527_21985 [Candidatus Omnitrophota bacterium]
MPTDEIKGIKLRHLKIKNFKALDCLEIDFPPPTMKKDPDIFIMGSKNGLGKTSVLESCALLFLIAVGGKDTFHFLRHPELPIDLNDLLIRAGARNSTIEGHFKINSKEIAISLSLQKSGEVEVTGNTELFRNLSRKSRIHARDAVESFLFSLIALNSEPLFLPPFLYFHSYRKVQEGNPELGMMVEGERYYRRSRLRPGNVFPISTFKLEILRSMMSQAELFEDLDDKEAKNILDKLNELVQRYAGGRIEKLRPSPDNTVDFRITPLHGGQSFTFDGLSSGQKEIISTLFLIWHYSKNNPGIILIDEPELHLNVEWHGDFIANLHELAPKNQYIIATHSEEIFSSVSEDRRVLLVSSGEN